MCVYLCHSFFLCVYVFLFLCLLSHIHHNRAASVLNPISIQTLLCDPAPVNHYHITRNSRCSVAARCSEDEFSVEFGFVQGFNHRQFFLATFTPGFTKRFINKIKLHINMYIHEKDTFLLYIINKIFSNPGSVFLSSASPLELL